MKKFTLILLYALSLHGIETSPAPVIEDLLRILEITGMDALRTEEPILDQMNNFAQKNLLRKGERWDVQTDRFETLSPQLKPLLTKLRFIEGLQSPQDNYLGALILGATVHTVRKRILYLDSEWKRGVRFSSIYFLGGARPLTIWEKSHVPGETETEMLKWLWNNIEVSDEMRSQVEVVFINSPMKTNLKTSALFRPTTEDNVLDWVKASPPLGHYLAISSAPYTPRQDLILQILAPKEYLIDTIGPEASKDEKMVIVLDELARYLFSLKSLDNTFSLYPSL